MKVAVEEAGRALEASRCFIRLGGEGESQPIAAQWSESGLAPVGAESKALPVSNLAVRERHTVAVADVSTAAELGDATLGDRGALLELESRSVLAVPLIVFERLIGVLSIHRREPHRWAPAEAALAEAVARELGLALHRRGS